MHHVIGDGLGLLLTFASLQEKYSPTQFIQTAHETVFSKTKSTLLAPFTVIYAAVRILLWPSDKHTHKLAGKRNNSISIPFQVGQMKQISRKHKATINDLVLALISTSLHEYYEGRRSAVNVLSPYSVRQIPDKIENHRLDNQITCMGFTLDLCKNFD
jgi:hypothetical protein